MNNVINEIKQNRKDKRQRRYYRSKLDAYSDEIIYLYKNDIFISEIARILRKKRVNKKYFKISDTQISRWLKKNGYNKLKEK